MTHRAAIAAVIVLSALIILALIGLVAGAIMKLSGHPTHDAGSGTAGIAYRLPPGATILSTATDNGKLILHVRSAEGEEIDILSTDDGHLIAQVKAAPPVLPHRQ